MRPELATLAAADVSRPTTSQGETMNTHRPRFRRALSAGAVAVAGSLTGWGAWAQPTDAAPPQAPASADAPARPAPPKGPLPEPPKPGTAAACEAPAVATSVPDTAPIRRCPTFALESGCQLPDGTHQGPWTVWNPDHACEFPMRSETWTAGRREGPAVVWRTLCPEAVKGKTPSCLARVAERGHLISGVREGVWEVYDDAGQLFEVGNYARGRRQGRWRRVTDGKDVEFVCYKVDSVTWRAPPGSDDAKKPCAETVDEGDGTVTVSDAQRNASKFAALAQRSTNLDLKVRYLRKAVELDPEHAGYRKLLSDAEAEQAERAKAAPASGDKAAPEAGKDGR